MPSLQPRHLSLALLGTILFSQACTMYDLKRPNIGQSEDASSDYPNDSDNKNTEAGDEVGDKSSSQTPASLNPSTGIQSATDKTPVSAQAPAEPATIYKTEIAELNPLCNKLMKTSVTIALSPSTGTYTWTRALKGQGCKGQGNVDIYDGLPSSSGKGLLLNVQTSGLVTSGVWIGNKLETGWFRWRWNDASKTSFTGEMNYGPLGAKETLRAPRGWSTIGGGK